VSRAQVSATASPAVEVGTAARTLTPGALAAAVGLRPGDEQAQTCATCGAGTQLLRFADVCNIERGPGRVYVDARGHVWIVRATGDREQLGRYTPRWDSVGNRPGCGNPRPVQRVPR